MRTPFRRLPAAVQDALIAVLVAVKQVVATAYLEATEPGAVVRPLSDLGNLGYVILAVTGLALVVRRRFPAAVFVLTALASLLYYALDFRDGPGWIALFVALYTLTASGEGRRSVRLAAVGITVLAAGWLLAAVDIEPRAALGWVFFRIGASVMSAALGESVRTRGVITADALARAELAERTREEEALARVTEERLRIAREVHDTVAHAIAVINVQAGTTAHVLDKRPEHARAALEAIERTSAQALREMRAVLGVLRADDDGAPAHHPGLGQVDELVGRAREAGLDVTVDAGPPATAIPTAVDAAAYRILQEAITNVIRHAGPTRATVGVQYNPDAVEIRVRDEGRRDDDGGSPAPSTVSPGAGAGRGIRGMRERCELLGGRLDVGPRDTGFEVHATLPLVPAGQVPA